MKELQIICLILWTSCKLFSEYVKEAANHLLEFVKELRIICSDLLKSFKYRYYLGLWKSFKWRICLSMWKRSIYRIFLGLWKGFTYRICLGLWKSFKYLICLSLRQSCGSFPEFVNDYNFLKYFAEKLPSFQRICRINSIILYSENFLYFVHFYWRRS